jgi:hypothetical protein
MVLAICSHMVQVNVVSRSECLAIHGNLLNYCIILMLFSLSCLYCFVILALHFSYSIEALFHGLIHTFGFVQITQLLH